MLKERGNTPYRVKARPSRKEKERGGRERKYFSTNFMPELQLVPLPSRVPSRCLRANNGCTSSENNHLSSVTLPPPPPLAPAPALLSSPLTPRALFCHREFFALAWRRGSAKCCRYETPTVTFSNSYAMMMHRREEKEGEYLRLPQDSLRMKITSTVSDRHPATRK